MPTLNETDTLLAYLNNPTVHIVAHLAQNTIDAAADMLQPSDFTESTFGGYAPVTHFDWEDVGNGSATLAEVLSAEILFQADATISGPQEATAMYITLQEGTNPPVLFDAVVFERPVLFENAGDLFKRQIRIQSSGFAA